MIHVLAYYLRESAGVRGDEAAVIAGEPVTH